ncbi:MAG: hypothetical protein FWD34_10735 [Oscillospiraceae bacterium]|nr:hypothetical protein [Oscillospiraceae bacterium]
MIIFDDLSLQTRSDVPNSDWTGGLAKYVVDDNSDLARKIFSFPAFEPVEDENGNLIDVIPVEISEEDTDDEQ